MRADMLGHVLQDWWTSECCHVYTQFNCIRPLYSEVGLLKILHMNPIEMGFFYSCIYLVEVPQEVPQELQVTTSDSSHLFPSADWETPAASPTF